jgi:multiple sugar transport system substrate-binding protein
MPDVIYIQDSWASSMFVQGMCVQLDDLFNAWDEKDQFDPACLLAMTSKDLQGRLFAIPTATNITGIWYRKDVFKEKGVEPPTTWDNFFTAVEKLTDKANNVYGHTLRGGAGSTNQLINEIICYAGIEDYWSADGKAQILRSDKAVECVEKFANIYKNGQTPESGLTAGFKEMVADFNAKLAMTLIHNLGSYENQRVTFTPDQYGFYPFPPSVTGKLGSQLGSAKGLIISSTSKYKDEAWE